jgi:PhnB protein
LRDVSAGRGAGRPWGDEDSGEDGRQEAEVTPSTTHRRKTMYPYVTFNGQCEAAFKFYETALGGKIVAMLRHGDMPMGGEVPPESKNHILHARLMVGDKVLMGSDAPTGRYEGVKGFYVSLSIQEPAEAERLYKALSEGGAVHMPIQETFWARRFAMFADKFGIPWMINCEKPQ